MYTGDTHLYCLLPDYGSMMYHSMHEYWDHTTTSKITSKTQAIASPQEYE